MSDKKSTSKESKTQSKIDSTTEDYNKALSELRIVGIGTSAGGLEALKTFFDNVPSNCPLSFVIIQHLSPDYKSLMAELLAKNTQLPIYEVKNNMEVKPGSVYLIPAKKNMMLKDGKLLLKDKPAGHDLNLPIDIFFRSMAEELGEKAIAVVLTGTGSDGTHGVRAIKEVGGMVMVQSPETAKFDGMPKSAISTGLVDYILPINAMPSEMLVYVENNSELGNTINERTINKNEDALQQILAHLKKMTNLDFSEYKKPTLIRRISRRMSVNKCLKLNDYLQYLYSTPQEAQILYKEFLIGVTKFFRDPEAFNALQKDVERIVSEKSPNQPLKMWSVACSTGEEAYSLAILTKEALEKHKKNLEVKIFATDIDKESLEVAGKGVYSESIVSDVGADRLKKWFVRKGDQYQVIQDLRKMIIFSHHNVLTDPPFNRMDLVSCRNLLIYLQPNLQQRLLATFHYSLNLKGVLFLGPSESIAEYKNVFKETDRRWKIFENTEVSRTLGFETNRMPDVTWNRVVKSPAMSTNARKAIIDTRLAEILSETLSEEFEAVSVYVDEHFDILHATGNLSKYLALPEMGFTINLLKMLNDSISVAISTAVRRANKERQKVHYRGVRLVSHETVRVIDVLVKPFKIDKLDTKTYYLVILLENKAVSNQEVMASISETDPTSATRISELQRELKETKENLQATVEEVETSNEELQATNEELLAANEELQSTNEELQSVNEEMHTVNAEHQSKIQELAALNADMDNLLKSTDIGTIFLDKELKIRWFTPAIKEQFNLLMADVGRPIANFSSNIKGMNIISEVEYVISTGKQVEKETYVEDGKKWFLSRVLPYQDGNYRIQGAVITFVDITQIKQVQLELELNESLFRALFETSPAAVITTDMDGVVETANQNAARLLSTEVSEVKGRDIFELFNASSRGKIKNLYKEKNATKVLRSTDEIFIKGRGGKEIPVSLITEQLEHKNKSLLLLNITDISEQLKSQKELQSLNEKLALKVEATTKEVGEKDLLLQHVLESTTAGYWIFDQGEGLIMSESFHSVFREEGDLVSSWDVWKDIMVEEDYEDFEAKYNAHVKSKGKTPFEVSCRMYRTDGNPLWIYIKGKVIEWQEKKPQKVVGSLVNISQLKNAQLELSNTNTKLERSLQELSLKNHELEQIAYVATHDLRAPVLNLSHLLKMFDTDQVEGKNQEVFEKIHSSVNQLNGTLNDLINIAAINNEEIPDRFKRVNLEKEFNTVLDSVDLLSKESQINISSVFKAKMLTYYPVHIKSIFQNLLTNAIKYRKKDSPLQVDVKTYESGNYTVIEITDNGIGIDLNKQGKKLFGMFKQLHAGYEGKGLGLYLVKTQVELLGGEIEVESEPGKGTTFKICLLDQKKFQKTRGAN